MGKSERQDKKIGSVLTPSQREKLKNGSDMSDDAWRSFRSRVRKRIAAGMEDLVLISENFEDDDIETALEDAPIIDVLAFLFERHLPPSDNLNERQEEIAGLKPGQYATDAGRVAFLGHVIKKAVNRAAENRGHKREYDVELAPRDPDPRTANALKQQFRAGEITADEIESLFHEGKISRDIFLEVAREFEEGSGDAE